MIGNQTSKILDPLIVVAGPTASGKSTMAVNLAEELNGEVVNIDSVQLYEGLNIGSGKISDKDKKGIKHHLLDIRKPSEPMDVADFISEAEKAISQVRSSNKTPVLVAGTTLYFKCLLHGLVDIPKADPKLRDELNVLTLEELVSRLERLDPTSLKKNCTYR